MAVPLPSKKFLRYLLVAVLTAIILGLVGFFIFINRQRQTIAGEDAARGISAEGGVTPSFEGKVGSGGADKISDASITETDSGSQNNVQKKPSRLWQVTRSPVAGHGFIGNLPAVPAAQAGSTSSRLYFAERSSGYIFEADPESGTVTRLSNRLLPKIYEAFFDSGGGVILRSLDKDGVITSFSGTVTASSTLFGKYLENNIKALSVNPKTGELFYLKSSLSGETAGITAMGDGTKQKNVFSSLLSDWTPVFLADGRIFVSINPSDNASGYAYEIKSGVLSPLLRNIPGLSFLPKAQSSAALFSSSQGGTIQLYALIDGAISAFPIKTLADKCVWASPEPGGEGALIAYCAVLQTIPSGNFINNWYQGALHTQDDWWRVNASDGSVDFLYSPEGGISFDVENPTIDAENKAIAFTNAADKTLWVLRIAEKAD